MIDAFETSLLGLYAAMRTFRLLMKNSSLSTAKQRSALSNKKSDFNKRILNLKEAEVPFSEEFGNLIQQLRKEVTYVVRDQRKYSARSVENIRQLQGRLIGTCSAILAVFYEE